MLYIAIGILGATVMPHNLYLHSAIVQTRKYERTREGMREAIKFCTIDSTIALTLALFVNAAILIVSAATFYKHGYGDVAEIQDAYKLLTPLLGVPERARCLPSRSRFRPELHAHRHARRPDRDGRLHEYSPAPWLRRLITRAIAIIPAAIVTAVSGESGTAKLLIFSQVILSMQLSFAVFPLVMFTSDKLKMGEFVNPRWMKILAWTVAIVIAALNVWLLWQSFTSWFA